MRRSGGSFVRTPSGGGLLGYASIYVPPPPDPPDPPAAGDFLLTINETEGWIVATSETGTPLSSGTFTIPTAGTYLVVIHGLARSERTITISDGTITKDGDTSPWSIDNAYTVELTIVSNTDDAVVTVS